jgi:phospho-N-acetylmuramoyl-pentapeptide-transferase
MFYQLVLYFQEFLHQTGLWTFANVFQYQTFRMACAVVTSFFVMMAFMPAVIRILRRLKIGDAVNFDNATVDKMNASKAGTPTMGGVLVLASIVLSTFLWADIAQPIVVLGLVTVVWLGGLGGVDDYLKLVKKSRDGLRMWEKLLFQIGLAVVLAYFLYQIGGEIQLPEQPAEGGIKGIALNLPFYKFPIALGFGAFAIITILVVAGTSNAVNLTDGMDGLAIGSMVPPTIVFLIISYIAGRSDWATYLLVPFVRHSGELSVFCGAILGACLGFLWYNCSPAQVFMGDTGSLALGGAIGYVAIATRQEVMLLLAGGLFVLEALSVIIQVGYFKFTKSTKGSGQRLLLMSPLHHHFQLGGWKETQTVVRFWLLGAMFAALALATLKLR